MDKPSKQNQYSLTKLFLEMLQISAFTFGGGFVMIGMMRKKFCETYHWISDEEVLDITAIAQSAPGALGINSAIIFGYRMDGVVGALVAVCGMVIPPIGILSLVTIFYNVFRDNRVVQIALQVMRAGVAAIIMDVVIDLATNVIQTKKPLNILLMIGAFIASWFFEVNAITLILIFLALGIALNFLQTKREETP